jgi:phosphoglycolate phosphatase
MALVVFDLDGTLVDSAPDIRAAVNRMLADQGQDPLDLSTIVSFVGHGLPKLVERVIMHLGLDRARQDELTRATLMHYSSAAAKLTRPYDGAIEALQALKDAGHILALCTNKPEAPARAILRDLALDGFFDAVVGGDSLAVKKPDPEPLLHLVRALGGGQVVFVGDSEVDAETAVRAGVRFVLYSEGYRKGAITQIPHAEVFDEFPDLPGVVAELVRPVP